MANINKGRLFLKLAAYALLKALQRTPVVGAVVEIGADCWKILRDEQEKCTIEERIAQLEQAAACTPEEAQQVVAEVVQKVAARGKVFAAERVAAVRDLMAVMPAQIQNRTRATLSHARRLGTAPAVALPVTNKFADPEREAFYTGLFPQRRPQFRAGDELPGADDWHLERLIGAGGFGEVWLARNQSLASLPPWAIKFCQDADSAKLLVVEKDNLGALMHKLPPGTANVVALHNLRFKAMPYWLAFEYVDGGTLESRMRLGPMSWPEAWAIFKPLLEGMAHVHKLDIVHRDLKPANILLDAQQRPRIADFGIGKILATRDAATQRTSRSFTVKGSGTFGYMSPEQAGGIADAHAADDVYALAIILWQMLAGQLQPLESQDDIDDLSAPDAIKAVIQECRFRRRDKRPSDAAALLARLLATQQATPSPVKNPQIVAQQEQSSSKLQSQAAAVSASTSSSKPGEVFRHKLTSGGQGPEMVMLPAGKFRMGSNNGASDETPIHEVTIAQEFAIGKYQVTFDDYDAFCTATSRQKPDDAGWGRGRRPVINVSWADAVAYCTWLSEQTGYTYRLPSEAEWEYAYRAGTTTEYSFGDDVKQLGDYAWFSGNSGGQTHPVGEKKPNLWGLYDMHGNVWEWCQDKWHGNYAGAPTDGSAWESGGSSGRLLRGCSCYDKPDNCRAAIRNYYSNPSFNLGFRVVFGVAGRAV